MASAEVALPAAASDGGAAAAAGAGGAASEEVAWAPAPRGSERFDLTPVLSGFLDRHLIIPLIDFLFDCQVKKNKRTRAWR